MIKPENPVAKEIRLGGVIACMRPETGGATGWSADACSNGRPGWPYPTEKEKVIALGSVSRILCGIAAVAIIRLGGALPRRSSDLPGRLASRAGSRDLNACASQSIRPYLVLLRVGFAMQRSLLNARCALTAPFHPYLWGPQ